MCTVLSLRSTVWRLIPQLSSDGVGRGRARHGHCTGLRVIKNQLRLRGIVVSTRSALQDHPGEGGRVRAEALRLLNALEANLIRDGADLQLLPDITAAREEFRE